MDLKALIDFNKYTLTLSAAAFVYTMANFVPVKSAEEVNGLLFILACFLVASLSGVLLFAAATSAQPNKPTGDQSGGSHTAITVFGNLHAALLIIGLIALALKLHARIIETVPAAQTQVDCHKMCAALLDSKALIDDPKSEDLVPTVPEKDTN